MLSAGREFWSSAKTLEMLRSSGCFDGKDGDKFSWPENFKPFISEGMCLGFYCITDQRHFAVDDPLGLTPANGFDLAVSALGACLWCLRRCFIDKELLSIKSFKVIDLCTHSFYIHSSVLCCVSADLPPS